jgi:hypothetical protein
MRTAAGTSSSFVSPTIGWTKRPSTVSSAAFVRYSCARWIGFRVWNATTVRQPRRANSARLARRQDVRRDRVDVPGQRRDLGTPGHRARRLVEQRRHAGVRGVGRAVHEPRLALEVALVDLVDAHRAQRRALRADQHEHVAALARLAAQGDGDRPRPAVGEAHRLDDRGPVRVAEEARERRVPPDGQQLDVRGLAGAERELDHAVLPSR